MVKKKTYKSYQSDPHLFTQLLFMRQGDHTSQQTIITPKRLVIITITYLEVQKNKLVCTKV